MYNKSILIFLHVHVYSIFGVALMERRIVVVEGGIDFFLEIRPKTGFFGGGAIWLKHKKVIVQA